MILRGKRRKEEGFLLDDKWSAVDDGLDSPQDDL